MNESIESKLDDTNSEEPKPPLKETPEQEGEPSESPDRPNDLESALTSAFENLKFLTKKDIDQLVESTLNLIDSAKKFNVIGTINEAEFIFDTIWQGIKKDNNTHSANDTSTLMPHLTDLSKAIIKIVEGSIRGSLDKIMEGVLETVTAALEILDYFI